MIRKIIGVIALWGVFLMSDLKAEETKSHKTHTQTAIFGMGCFWCGESEFRDHETGEKFPGIVSIRVGYAGGTKPNPTYESHEGYKEAVKIEFDPNVITYNTLLDIFWHNVDPFDEKGQFCDKGFPYTSIIYYVNAEQKKEAEAAKKAFQSRFKEKIVTEIIHATSFHDAEEYHQDFKAKNPLKYKFYRWNCGRDKRLKAIWEGATPSNGTP